MQPRLQGNGYRTTVVCIDSYQSGVPAGRLYNPYLEDGEAFQSLTQFLTKMGQLLDAMRLPQSFTAARSFPAPPPHREGGPPQPEPQEGKLATFALRIIFRQNASWQGSVTWLEEGAEQSFRSVLELILLMDSALNETEYGSEKRVPVSQPDLGQAH